MLHNWFFSLLTECLVIINLVSLVQCSRRSGTMEIRTCRCHCDAPEADTLHAQVNQNHLAQAFQQALVHLASLNVTIARLATSVKVRSQI